MSSLAARKVAKTLAAFTVGASTSEAAIVVFDINPDVQTRSPGMLGSWDGDALSLNNINLAAGTFTSSFFSGSYLAVSNGFLTNQFTFGSLSYYGGYQVAAGQPTGSGNARVAVNGSGASTFAFGQSIGAGNTWYNVANGNTDLPAGTGYYGLRLDNGFGDYNYGWIEVTHSNEGDLWTRFAFEKIVNQSILTGQTVSTPVPEASTLGFAGGLFGLVAAAHLRRRKLKQAAASDKFLALAAGEKLN